MISRPCFEVIRVSALWRLIPFNDNQHIYDFHCLPLIKKSSFGFNFPLINKFKNISKSYSFRKYIFHRSLFSCLKVHKHNNNIVVKMKMQFSR